MTRQFIAGGLYGDHLPSGAWCVLVPKVHCETHLGIVPFPDGETFGPLFVRCTDVGGFRFAGQAHDSENPAAYERIGTAWASLPPPCFGVSPLIYDHDGNLHCSNGSVGSQGYRYVTPQNVLISGDATYGPFHGLFEYTYLEDGLWIGQGAEDGSGIRVLESQTDERGRIIYVLRQLETGTCRFLRANRVDNTVALAFTRPEGVVLIRTTMAELRALPPVTAPGPVEKVPGPIVHSPEKESEMSVPESSVAVAVAAADTINVRYPNLRVQKNFDWICKVVYLASLTDPRIGHSSSHSDTTPTRRNELGIREGAGDVNGKQAYTSVSLFQINPAAGDPMRDVPLTESRFDFWFPPTPVDLGGAAPSVPSPSQPPAPPPTQPPAPPVDLSPFLTRIAVLEATRQKDAADIAMLVSAVAGLMARPVGTGLDLVALDAALAAYEVTGDTNATGAGWLRHGHGVKLKITKVKP